MRLTVNKASTRNTESYWVQVGGTTVLFSYSTAMAFEGREDGHSRTQLRRENTRSNTTRRHLRESGCMDYAAVDDEQFDRRLAQALDFGINPLLTTWNQLKEAA